MILQDILQELGSRILPGSSRPAPGKTVLQIEFYRYTPAHYTTHVYLIDQCEIASLSFPPREEELVLFIACANGLQPDYRFPAGYAPIYVHAGITQLVHSCFMPYHREETRRQIAGIFRMAERAHLTVSDLLRAACQPLSIGVCLFRSDGELVTQDCADTIFQAYMPDTGRKTSFFDMMIPHIRDAIRSGSKLCFKDELCFELGTFRIGNNAEYLLVVFYDRKNIFDFPYFLQQVSDYAVDQNALAYTSLDHPPADILLRRILDGSMKDYPAIADILYGADHRMKSFRVLQIRPIDPNVPWQQWVSALQITLRNAFYQFHISHDGTTVTALLIAQYSVPRDHTETKNSVEPLRCYTPGWDRDLLKKMLRQAGANCMLSAVTSSLDMIPLIHEQTLVTLDIATHVEPPSSQGRFWEHTNFLPYLPIHYGLEHYREKNFSPKAMGLWIHPEVFRLLRNDVLTDKDHAQVLYAYLQNGMDVAEVSRILYMHRNTVYARLKAIEAFTGLNLKDRAYQNAFLPSLRLYYYCRDYLGIGNEHLLLINRNDSFTDIFMADSPLLSPDSVS